MVRLDRLSDDALGILSRLLAGDPVADWILQSVKAEREARRAEGQRTLPLLIPLMALEDARILNRHLIAAAHTLEDLGWEPHADNFPDEPFIEGARFLAQVSEELGKHVLAGGDKLQ